jgi:excisionase family DNA binding protein
MTVTIEKHFSIAEVADALGKSQRTIQRWIEAGKLRAAKFPGRYGKPNYAIPRSELEKLGVSFTDVPEVTEE